MKSNINQSVSLSKFEKIKVAHFESTANPIFICFVSFEAKLVIKMLSTEKKKSYKNKLLLFKRRKFGWTLILCYLLANRRNWVKNLRKDI